MKINKFFAASFLGLMMATTSMLNAARFTIVQKVALSLAATVAIQGYRRGTPVVGEIKRSGIMGSLQNPGIQLYIKEGLALSGGGFLALLMADGWGKKVKVKATE